MGSPRQGCVCMGFHDEQRGVCVCVYTRMCTHLIVPGKSVMWEGKECLCTRVSCDLCKIATGMLVFLLH